MTVVNPCIEAQELKTYDDYMLLSMRHKTLAAKYGELESAHDKLTAGVNVIKKEHETTLAELEAEKHGLKALNRRYRALNVKYSDILLEQDNMNKCVADVILALVDDAYINSILDDYNRQKNNENIVWTDHAIYTSAYNACVTELEEVLGGIKLHSSVQKFIGDVVREYIWQKRGEIRSALKVATSEGDRPIDTSEGNGPMVAPQVATPIDLSTASPVEVRLYLDEYFERFQADNFGNADMTNVESLAKSFTAGVKK
jgi:hypothetical protein